ncbi:hypothetical protein DRE_06677 [Drechslerella stenobrocha 248]|uniref:Uncharacterized protein n=1 Tax=Drechslerella stenobrocha 248 TaxID=1043628 RepID=W7HKS8_9PEZI|nr:hypothetical protein DRE_06677 [Drechslerella stenobrocha 248]
MADESARGGLLLESCDELVDEFSKRPEGILQDKYQRFMSIIEPPLQLKPISTKPLYKLPNWVYPASGNNQLLMNSDTPRNGKDLADLGDNTKIQMKKSSVCGGYVASGQPGNGYWSMLADVELTAGKPWRWGCGYRPVIFKPSFELPSTA